MAEAVQLMRDLSRSPEFLHLETMREMSRLDEGQRISNAEERGEKRGITIGEKRGITIGEKRGITIGEKRGEGRIVDLLRQGISPAEIIAQYGQ